jgi:hypothetical protein
MSATKPTNNIVKVKEKLQINIFAFQLTRSVVFYMYSCFPRPDKVGGFLQVFLFSSPRQGRWFSTGIPVFLAQTRSVVFYRYSCFPHLRKVSPQYTMFLRMASSTHNLVLFLDDQIRDMGASDMSRVKLKRFTNR